MKETHQNLPEEAKEKGSPQSGEPVFLAVGRLRRPHGLGGEILMDVLTAFPERLKKGKTVFVGDLHQPYKILRFRWQDQAMLLTFEEINSEEAAGHLRNKLVYTSADNLPALPEGEYYHHQLLGLEVVDEVGNSLGTLVEILETGANDVYVIRSQEKGETLLPAIEAVIREVDLEKRRIIVKPPEWA
jgi:16S rRNA processing protein RimM